MLQVAHTVTASLLGEAEGHRCGLTEGFDGAFHHDGDVGVTSEAGIGRTTKVDLFNANEVTVGPIVDVDAVDVRNFGSKTGGWRLGEVGHVDAAAADDRLVVVADNVGLLLRGELPLSDTNTTAGDRGRPPGVVRIGNLDVVNSEDRLTQGVHVGTEINVRLLERVVVLCVDGLADEEGI